MQYVEGEDLAFRLERCAKPPLEETLAIFRQLCGALAAAHDKGVIHRDMKPQNVIMAADGTVYVTDFGLARSLELTGLTQTGSIMGTPHYMSPEQVQGEAVDARTDVYALGVLLYQMLTGEYPFSGESSFEVMIQRTQRDPRPAAELNPEIPTYLSRILERCLSRDAGLRYSQAGEILQDLDAEQVETSLLYWARRNRPWLIAATMAILAVLIVFGWKTLGLGREEGMGGSTATSEFGFEAELAAVKSIGILPLDNLTGRQEMDWIGEGMARLVMDNLAQSRHVRVVSMDRMRSLAEQTAGEPSTKEAAAQGIDFLVEGEILQGVDGLTVTARVTDTDKGTEVVSKRLDRMAVEEVMRGSDELAAAARQGLGIPPTESVDVFAADFASSNPEAYAAFLDGMMALGTYRHEEAETGFVRSRSDGRRPRRLAWVIETPAT
jgi:TolB-like protein